MRGQCNGFAVRLRLFLHGPRSPAVGKQGLARFVNDHVRDTLQPHEARSWLIIHQQQEVHRHTREHPTKRLHELRNEIHLVGRIHGPHKNAGLGQRHLPLPIEASDSSCEVLPRLWLGGVVVPEAATPSARKTHPSRLVVLARRMRQEVRKVVVEAVKETGERTSGPIEGIGEVLQVQGLQRPRHCAEAAETNVLTTFRKLMSATSLKAIGRAASILEGSFKPRFRLQHSPAHWLGRLGLRCWTRLSGGAWLVDDMGVPRLTDFGLVQPQDNGVRIVSDLTGPPHCRERHPAKHLVVR
mmetsp:Transcript_33420/g.89415  ORF Transcript_33420/g.89415 Transcript_33420/m.89415 type:complete len:298 (-) Transcript_33420:111-1004(-)